MEIKLPTQKTAPTSVSPRKLLIYSKPKVGKTQLLAELDNCLIIDTERGSGFVEAMRIECNSTDELKEICRQIIIAKKPYKYVALDTITKLEEMCIPLALQLYRATPMGKKFGIDEATGKPIPNTNILTLPNGGGYLYLREAFMMCLSWVFQACDRVILLGHLKDTVIERNGKEVSAKDVDLTGKIKSMTSAGVDAIGLLFRSDENKNTLTFKTTDDVICGARPPHLKNQDIIISEMKDGKFVAYWDKIFVD